LLRHIRVFPSIPLIFISDNDNHLDKAKKLGIDTFRYVATSEIDFIFDDSKHDQNFRSNFWRTSVERIFALSQFHEENPSGSVLHFESDVMLMPSFPWHEFNKLQNLAWGNTNTLLDCAAIFFSPSDAETKWLCEQLKLRISLDGLSTDMKALREIRELYPKKILLLPSTPPGVSTLSNFSQEKELPKITNHNEAFGGIFDFMEMGMWLTGENPRNLGGKVVRYRVFYDDNRITFTPGFFRFQGGKLYVGGNDQTLLHNLHVHSKNRNLLSVRWVKELRNLVHSSETLSDEIRFSLTGWVGSTSDIYVSVGKRPLIALILVLKANTFGAKLKKIFTRSLKFKSK
jgi:hypothetical protein